MIAYADEQRAQREGGRHPNHPVDADSPDALHLYDIDK